MLIGRFRAQRRLENDESLLGGQNGCDPQPAGRVADAQQLAQPISQPQLPLDELVRRLRGHRCHGLDRLVERHGADSEMTRATLRLALGEWLRRRLVDCSGAH
jgi:hypothetical protein